MCQRGLLTAIALLMFTFSIANADIGNINLDVKEVAGVGATAYPVTAVVPLPEGLFADASNITLVDSSGQPVPAQISALTWWARPQRSIRHLQIEFQPTVDAFAAAGTGIARYYIRLGVPSSPATPVTVAEDAVAITVTTGPLKFVVSKTAFNIIDQLWYDQNGNGEYEPGELIIASHSLNGGVFVPPDGTAVGRTVLGGTQYDTARSDLAVTVEESGPMRAVVRVEAPTKFYSANPINHLHGFAVRIYAYAGKPYIKIDYQLQNSAMNRPQAKWSWPLYFDALNVDFRLGLSGDPTVRFGMGDGTIYQRNRGSGVYLAQESDSAFRIYDRQSGSPLAGGAHPEGFIDISDANAGVTAMVRYLWQQWPNGLEVDDTNRLSFQLFPSWSAQWWDPEDYTGNNIANLRLSPLGLYWLEDMQHVYKEMMLYFHGAGETNSNLVNLARTFQWHPVAIIPASWWHECRRSSFDYGIPLAADTNGEEISRLPSVLTANYLGWDWFECAGSRKYAPASGGGDPDSNLQVTITENPADWYVAERRLIGELNTRNHWMAQYDHGRDFSFLRLTAEPYETNLFRSTDGAPASGKLAASYLSGTWWDSVPRDDEHAWYYHVEDTYYLTANPWIRDWYRFMAEFTQVRLCYLGNTYGADIPDGSTRGHAHSLAEALQSYRVLTDGTSYRSEILDRYRDYIRNILRPQQSPIYGACQPAGNADQIFMVGFLSRNIIRYMEEVRLLDPQAYAEAFNYLAGLVTWNVNYANFMSGGTTYRVGPAQGSSSGHSYPMIDSQTWYYWHTGYQPALDQVNQYISGGINGGAAPYYIPIANRWSGDFTFRFESRRRAQTRADTTPPPAITDLKAHYDPASKQLVLTFSSPGNGAARYHVVWGYKPISQTQTADTAQLNWWAANAYAPVDANNVWLVPKPAGKAETIAVPLVAGEPVLYAAVFSFDCTDGWEPAENMSPMSNVAAANCPVRIVALLRSGATVYPGPLLSQTFRDAIAAATVHLFTDATSGADMVDDAFIDGYTTTRYTNYGASTTAPSGKTALYRFNTAAIGDLTGSQILKAELQLYFVSDNQDPLARQMLTDWFEGNKAGSYPGAAPAAPGITYNHPKGTNVSGSGLLGWGPTGDQAFNIAVDAGSTGYSGGSQLQLRRHPL